MLYNDGLDSSQAGQPRLARGETTTVSKTRRKRSRAFPESARRWDFPQRKWSFQPSRNVRQLFEAWK